MMVPTPGSDASSLARGWLAMRVVIAASSSEGEVWGVGLARRYCWGDAVGAIEGKVCR